MFLLMFGLYTDWFNVFAGVVVKCFIDHSKEECSNLTFSFSSASETKNYLFTLQF
jgi:hypothetical protein